MQIPYSTLQSLVISYNIMQHPKLQQNTMQYYTIPLNTTHYSLASPFWAGQYWWIYPKGQGGYSGKGTANIA